MGLRARPRGSHFKSARALSSGSIPSGLAAVEESGLVEMTGNEAGVWVTAGDNEGKQGEAGTPGGEQGEARTPTA